MEKPINTLIISKENSLGLGSSVKLPPAMGYTGLVCPNYGLDINLLWEMLHKKDGEKTAQAINGLLEKLNAKKTFETIEVLLGGNNHEGADPDVLVVLEALKTNRAEIMDQITYSSAPQKIKIVIPSVRELGLSGVAGHEEIIEQGAKWGLQPCPAEMGPEFYLQYAHKRYTGNNFLNRIKKFHFAMSPIPIKSNDKKFYFAIECIIDRIYFSIKEYIPDIPYSENTRWAFILPD
jgi:hypothetical protein